MQLDPAREVRLVLGDQLDARHEWFAEADPGVLYLIMEMRQETDYARHHVQKVLAFFLAMRAFADERRADGHRVHYLALDDPANTHSLAENLEAVLEACGARHFAYQEPDSWRVDRQLAAFTETLEGVESRRVEDAHFLTRRHEAAEHFRGKKTWVMESFYRAMRKKHAILIESDDAPAGGKWNFDASNRKRLPKGLAPPPPRVFDRDVGDLLSMLDRCGVETLGRVEPDRFGWPVTREEGLETLRYFVDTLLPHFGDYQDAMTPESWSLFHSRLSFVLNAKLISPREVVAAVEARWRSDPEHADIAQVEGFVRQVLGWREYMRGLYWEHMPEFAERNFFAHDRPLPGWYWTGETRMACLRHAIGQTLDHAYAHHIQRLMVTGNFALLVGVDPDAVDAWYLGVYVDALHWVEVTNTRGMSQFADGGLVGTKPYVSSANYLKKMGPYCTGCAYSASERVGEGACPFNSLYWHFHHRHREKLEGNPRIGMVYRTWDKMSRERREALLSTAEAHLENLEQL